MAVKVDTQLQKYVLTNNRIRRRAERWSIVVGILLAWVSMLSGTSAVSATKQGLALSVLILSLTTIYYGVLVTNPNRSAATLANSLTWRRGYLVGSLFTAVATALLWVSRTFHLPTVGNRNPPAPAVNLQQFAKMDQHEFERSLSSLRSELGRISYVASRQEEDALKSLAARLDHASEDLPEYWPAVLTFLEFATSRNASKVPPANAIVKLSSKNETVFPINDHDSLVELNGGSLINSTFIRCRVRFTDVPTGLQNVIFIDSVVEFRGVDGVPAKPLRDAAKVMLASDLSQIQM